MLLALCADQENGLAFNHRRQSRDRGLWAELLRSVGQAAVWVSPYTARQVPEDGRNRVSISEEPWNRAGERELCFLELADPAPFLDRVSELWLYRWDKVYPADLYLALPSAWKLTAQTEFPGHSHEVILKEVYHEP